MITLSHAETIQHATAARISIHVEPLWLAHLAQLQASLKGWNGNILKAESYGLDCLVLLATQILAEQHLPVTVHRVCQLEQDFFPKWRIRTVWEENFQLTGPGNWPTVYRENAEDCYQSLLQQAKDRTDSDIATG